MKYLTILLTLIPTALCAAETSQESSAAGIILARDVDILWVCISAGLVFFMQAGFLMLEAGLVRSKNSINVAVKNLIDYIAGSVLFFAVGYALMFGTSMSGMVGTDLFLLNGLSHGKEYAFFLFQVAFMGTAATIVSGAVAERIKFHAYLVVSVVISLLIYPVFGHWTWGGGWLSQMGFVDFAGSTVVHSVGGWVALAGVIVLGPRMDRFDDNGKSVRLYGHDLPASVLGTLILWLGWFGFNGGSTLAVSDSIPLILVNTSLCASTGGMSAMCFSALKNRGRSSVEDIINGVIGGLVAITAGCNLASPVSSALLGIAAGIITTYSAYAMETFFKLDDVVGAFPVHGLCGIAGTIAVPFIASGNNPGLSLAVQLLGVVSCGIWSFGTGFLLFFILKQFTQLRVSPGDEEEGLNSAEHGARTILGDLLVSMKKIADAEGLPERLKVDHGSDMYLIGIFFNKVIDNIEAILNTVENNAGMINSISRNLNDSAGDISDAVLYDSGRIEEISAVMENIRDSFDLTRSRTLDQKKSVEEGLFLSDELSDSYKSMSDQLLYSAGISSECNGLAEKGRIEISAAVSGIKEIERTSGKVGELVSILRDISDQLHLLALNASIEAARNGSEGNGFAIVAEEIAKLAVKTKSNTVLASDFLSEIDNSITLGADNLMSTASAFMDIIDKVVHLDSILKELETKNSEYSNIVTDIAEKLKSLHKDSDFIYLMVSDRAEEVSEAFTSINELNDTIAELQDQSVMLTESSTGLREKAGNMLNIVMKYNKSAPLN